MKYVWVPNQDSGIPRISHAALECQDSRDKEMISTVSKLILQEIYISEFD